MRTAAGVVLCIGFVLSSASARAETIYKYRDRGSGRDVFVNRLDQIPRKYRDQAKIVVEGAGSPGGTGEQGEVQPAPGEESAEPATGNGSAVVERAKSLETNLRKAVVGKNLLKDGPAIACALVDAKLIKAGTIPLTESERTQLSRLLTTTFVLSVLAGIFAFVVWVVMMVTAIRDGRLWWALFMLLFVPLAYVYLFVHAGKERWPFKLVCAFGMLSPALVGLVGVWRFYGWFQAVIQARGGKV